MNEIWFKKPISRCPNCNRVLRQNTQKKKWKEKNRFVFDKKFRARTLKQLRVKRWKAKNKDHLKKYNEKYWSDNKDRMKQERIADGRYAVSLEKNSEYQKKHLKEILEKRKQRIFLKILNTKPVCQNQILIQITNRTRKETF